MQHGHNHGLNALHVCRDVDRQGAESLTRTPREAGAVQNQRNNKDVALPYPFSRGNLKSIPLSSFPDGCSQNKIPPLTPPHPPKPTNSSIHRTGPPSTPVRVTIPSPIHLGLTGYLLPQEYLPAALEGMGPPGSHHLSTLPTARRPRRLANSPPVDGSFRCVALW